MAKKGISIVNPIFSLRAMSVDHLIIENLKKIQHESGVIFLNIGAKLDLNVRGGSKVLLLDDLNVVQILITIIMETSVPSIESKIKIMEITTAYDFEIANYSNYRKSSSEFTFPREFFDKLSNISLSTTRGVIFTKIAGTALQGVILPIIHLTPIDLSQVVVIPKGQITTL